MSSIQPIYAALAALLAAFIQQQTAEAAKAIRKEMLDLQRGHDGRVPEEIRPEWKALHPQLGAFIDGRQPVEGTLAAARMLAEVIDPPAAVSPKATRKKKPDPAPDPEPAPEPSPAE